MLVKYQDSCSTCPLGLTRVASSSPNSEVFPLFEGVWGHPRRKSLGYHRKKQNNKTTTPPLLQKQNHSDYCLQGPHPGLIKQICGYFWCGLQKAKDGWPGGCQSAKPNSFLSSVLKIYPAERSVRRVKATGQKSTLLSHDPWPTGLQVLLKQLSNQLQQRSSSTTELVCNKMMVRPSAKDGHFPVPESQDSKGCGAGEKEECRLGRANRALLTWLPSTRYILMLPITGPCVDETESLAAGWL